MPVENSTANQTSGGVNKTLVEYFTKTPAFFDPAWQLALTIEFYFQYAILGIGIFGTAANALVLYALVTHNASQAKKRAVNLLIINQNLLDLTCCILLVITFSVKVSNIYLTGTLGYLLCNILLSELAIYCVLNASVINLMSLTVERYLKVVHPFWSKKKLKRWMIHAAMVFAWIFGTASVAPVVFVSTIVQDGVCLGYYVWESEAVKQALLIWTAFSYFLMPVVIFLYCYGRIVVVMKRQMRVMAGHGGGTAGSAQPNASQIQNKRIKWNIVKTMIIVSVAFVICWFPVHTYWIIAGDSTTGASVAALYAGYNATVFLAYLNICMNPFIYAVKHDGVKEKLVGIVKAMGCGCCKRNDVTAPADVSTINHSNRTRIDATQQTGNAR